MMKPGQKLYHKLTKETFLYLGGGEKDEAKIGIKVIVRNRDYAQLTFYDFELGEATDDAG